jgi:DDE superfamily endonuclease
MPPHSSHLLQPLDVGCFSVLKQSYGRSVEQLISLGVNHIDKQEFLSLYQQARMEALHEKNIKSGFTATGLVPYDPDRVLSLLNTQFHTPSPQRQPPNQPVWTAETPHNIIELQHQTELIKQYLRRRTQSPPSPTERAVNQLIKGCQLAMHSAVLLAHQNDQLYKQNQRQKQKRAQRRSYIARGGVLTGAKAQQLIEEGETSHQEAVQDMPTSGRQRALPKCGICSLTGHNARTCPERQSTA